MVLENNLCVLLCRLATLKLLLAQLQWGVQSICFKSQCDPFREDCMRNEGVRSPRSKWVRNSREETLGKS